MSMPSFPEQGTDITCEQAFNMLLGSIAMEELALSHILNAEGEKLQYILGTCKGHAPVSAATPSEVLQVNESISTLLENVAHNQLLLKGKLKQVLDAKEKWSPPPCPPAPCCCQKGTWMFRGKNSTPWRCGYPMLWECVYGSADHCPQHTSPSLFYLDTGAYFVSYSFQLRGEGQISIVMETAKQGRCKAILTETKTFQHRETEHISGCITVPHSQCPFQFTLLSPQCVTVEAATVSLTVL